MRIHLSHHCSDRFCAVLMESVRPSLHRRPEVCLVRRLSWPLLILLCPLIVGCYGTDFDIEAGGSYTVSGRVSRRRNRRAGRGCNGKCRGPHPAPTHTAFPDAEMIRHMRAYLVIAQSTEGVSQMASCPTRTGSCQLNNLMRMLREQHATWTRMTIISIAEALPAEAQTTTRPLELSAE